MSHEGYGNSYISVGPWGGQSGARWDDGVYNTVRQVVICHGAAIDSIQFEYDKRGSSVWSEKHGGTGCLKTSKVKLDCPDEYLVSISGHCGCVVDYGPVLIRSLMFESNKKKYGPFGIQYGTYFSIPMTGGKIVGFHGRSSWYLDSIGAYLMPLLRRNPSNNFVPPQNYPTNGTKEKYKGCVLGAELSNKAVSYGPWGGNGGNIFDDGVYTGVRQVHLAHYGGVVWIRVCYDLNGQSIWGSKNGGSGGIRLDKLAFDYPYEILTHITGYYGSTILREPTVVKSLTFYTNRRTYGPFGDEQGRLFSSGSNNGVIVGFHGRKGWFIDSIGVHVMEGTSSVSRPIPRPSYESFKFNEVQASEVIIPVVVKEAPSTVSGLWGGGGGTPWDDGVFSGVKKIFLTKGEAIYCIQIEYDRNGQSLWSARHGGGSEGSFNMIKFDYPYEVLTSVCGYYASLTGDDQIKGGAIKSLTFYTNKARYGPYGEETGTFFTAARTEGRIVGFHGRSGCYLNAIGVHLQQWPNDVAQQGLGERGGPVKMITNNISKPPLTIANNQDSLSEFSQKPIKSSISFTNNSHPKFTDYHLDSLCRNGRLTDAVTALDSIAQHGSKVTSKTYMNLLQSCIDNNSINLGRKVHDRISVVQEKTSAIETKLVSMYAKCGYLRDARKVFDEMSDKNLFTWSAMMGACSRDKRWKEVVELYYMMVEDDVLPDGFLLPKILQAVGNCGDIKTGELLHSFVVKCGMGSSPRVNNSILAVYAKCGKLSLARRFFESMDDRDRVAWNAMMSGYCLKGEIEEARRLFDAMCEEGIEPSLVTLNILIAGYNQKGECDVAMDLMKKMVTFGVSPDVVAWTAMISGFGQNNRNGQALDLFKEMILAGVEPNGVTITSGLSACASLKVLNMGLEIHSLAVKMGFIDDVLVGNSLIDMYSKCGQLDAAQLVFDSMLEKDLYTWNSMIGGYCQAGYCGKAYVLFMKMQKSQVQPNVVTWNTMISGYIQSGDEDQAMDLFHRMEKEGKIERDNASWNSLIAGFLQIRRKDEALGIFRQMQSFGVSPNPVTILSVLPACANLVALKKAKEIHGCVLRRNLSGLSIANSLIDTYAKSGKIEYSRAIFDRMLSKDFITVNSMITGYVLHGCSDSALGLVDQMRELGLKPNRGTLVNIILAHSLAGMVDEGKQVFSSMTEDYQIIPASEHYGAMVDLYGRSGKIKEAVELIDNMPIKPESSVWSTLLTACRNHGNSKLAIRARERLLDLEPWNSSIHQSILQSYAMHGKSENAPKTKLEKENKVQKPKGQSWIEANNTVHSFVAERISTEAKVHNLNCGCCIEEEEEEEKEEIVGIHSEKLALAFAIVRSPSAPQMTQTVYTTLNLGVVPVVITGKSRSGLDIASVPDAAVSVELKKMSPLEAMKSWHEISSPSSRHPHPHPVPLD
ncbi:unnamed protein product [Dovyalis caffra]|uniref:Jacalin-type lectin domain-containing protein n=1 Tax=Dovyalis caffra TaxID=77055 RepID=A0AAV1S704_9ROSI|nr:unnamed protein product [Dovyalis caffra]